MSAYGEQAGLLKRQEEIQVALEGVGDDMARMSDLVDELDAISNQACAPCRRRQDRCCWCIDAQCSSLSQFHRSLTDRPTALQ